MNGEKVSFGEKIAYGLGDVGCNFVWTVVGTFLTLYYTDVVGISAAVVGTLMLVTRFLDGLSDLGMGAIIDRTHTRWGKARPWVGFTAPLMALGLILLFNVPMGLSNTGKIVYASFTYILLAVVIYTACNLAYCTLLSLMTPNQQERTSLSSIRFFLTILAILFIVYTTNPLIEAVGWSGMSIIFGIAGMLFLLVTFFFTKERTNDNGSENVAEKISVIESFKILFKNKYFIFVALLFVINYAAMNISNGVGVYYVRDILGNIGAFGTVTAMGFLPSILVLPFFPKLVNCFGKWKCMMIGYFMQAAGLIIVFLFPTNFALLSIGLLVKGFGAVPHAAGLFAMVGDVVDYGDWKFGKRIEAMSYSATSFGMKVGTGIGSAIVGWGLAFGGYDGALATQSAFALVTIKALYTWVPLILVIGGTIILAMCNLDKIYPVIQKDLAKRKK